MYLPSRDMYGHTLQYYSTEKVIWQNLKRSREDGMPIVKGRDHGRYNIIET